MKKRIITTLAVISMAAAMLTACGSKAETVATEEATTVVETEVATTEDATEEATTEAE